ncbi:MAG: hypothetical protein VX519_05015 [Myxococcota bacterium]|nr:hypothetical protein [Myxococcota bacterium]
MTAMVSILLVLTIAHAIGLGCGLAILAVERGKSIRLELRGVSAFIRELSAHLLFLGLKLGDRLRPDPLRSADTEGLRTPVLLVPGYADGRSTLMPLASYLRTRGWGWVHIANHLPFSAPVPDLAESVAREARRLQETSGSDRVDIVAFSMGGVLSTWAINHLNCAQSIGKLVAIATPFSGTRTAVFGMRRQASDLLPDSQCIQDLGAPQVPTTAIRSTFDTVILPASSAQLPENEPLYTNHLVHWHGHHAMLLSTEVFALIASALDTDT